MDRAQLDERCEQAILGLVLALLVYGPLALGGVRPTEHAVQIALVLAAALLWIARLWLWPEPRLLWAPVCLGVLLFVDYALVRYHGPVVEYTARGELARVLTGGLLFFVVFQNLHGRRATTALAEVLVALGAVVSAYALYQFLTRSDMVWHFVRPAQYAGRGSGPYICPNHLAGLLEMVLPLGLAYLLIGRLGATRKILLGYGSLVIFAGLAVTGSRGGWIAAGLAVLALFAVLMFRRASRLPAVLLLAALASGATWFVSSSMLAQRRMEQAHGNPAGENVRFLLWKPAVAIWREHPWLGVGPAQFDHHFRRHRPPEVQQRALRVHNDYLNTLTDWGLVGFALVAGTWGVFFGGLRRIWAAVQQDGDDLGNGRSNRAAFVLGGSAGLVALLVHSLVDFNFHVPANALLAITLLAAVAAQVRHLTPAPWLRPGPGPRLVITLVLLLGIGWLGRQARAQYVEGRLLVLSDEPGLVLNDELELLNRLAVLEPMNPDTAFRIGEAHRVLGWERDTGYLERMETAMRWFGRAIELDPLNSYPWIRMGMCLDLLRRYDEATPFFLRAKELDPNSAFTLAHVGWHYLQVDDYAKARVELEASWRINWWDNPIAEAYREILNDLAPPEPVKP